MSNNLKCVKLNVGGIKFRTSLATLRSREPNSFPKILDLDGNSLVSQDEDGSLFIDRDGNTFEHVLSFLRTGQVFGKDTTILRRILCEAQYYQLNSLESLVKKKLQREYKTVDSEELKNYGDWEIESISFSDTDHLFHLLISREKSLVESHGTMTGSSQTTHLQPTSPLVQAQNLENPEVPETNLNSSNRAP